MKSKNIFKKFFNNVKSQHWNNRKIAFVAILIATSVSFVLIFAKIFPIVAIPTFKIAIGGLPIKITGYIFGPFIGALTGVISDVLSFALFPTIFHYWYTLAFAMAGFIPGIVGYLMHRKWKYKGVLPKKDTVKFNMINFVITIIVILISISIIASFLLTRSQADMSESKMVSDKYILFGIVASGPASMLLFVLVSRLFFSPKTFNSILPIITFSVVLDVINTPLITLGDIATTINDGDFITLLTAHTLFTPVKSWSNLFIIYFAYKVVSPLIYNKSSNGWENETTQAVRIKDENIKAMAENKKNREKNRFDPPKKVKKKAEKNNE